MRNEFKAQTLVQEVEFFFFHYPKKQNHIKIKLFRYAFYLQFNNGKYILNNGKTYLNRKLLKCRKTYFHLFSHSFF